MARYKKIIIVSSIALFVISIVSCSVNKPRYVSLYVDALPKSEKPIQDKQPLLSEVAIANFHSDAIEKDDDFTPSVIITDENISNAKIIPVEDSIFVQKSTNITIDSIAIKTTEKKPISDKNAIANTETTKYVASKKATVNDSIVVGNKAIKQIVDKNENASPEKNEQQKEKFKVEKSKNNSQQPKEGSYSNLNLPKLNDDKNAFESQLKIKNDSIQLLKAKLVVLENKPKTYEKVLSAKIEEPSKPVIAVPVATEIQNVNEEKKNLALRKMKTDTVPLANEIVLQTEVKRQSDTIATKKTVSLEQSTVNSVQKDTTLKTLKDSITLLKNKFALIETAKAIQDTVFVEKIMLAPIKEVKKPVIFTAYYDIGQTQPSNAILAEVIKVLPNLIIKKIELKGYTDSSGNPKINKKLTTKRIQYLYNKIMPLVSIDKIFIQNFGQTFAAKEVVEEERRVEIKIFIE